ncbi:IclR family transcriptional regulator domain-containing protein [Actinocorallia longicatena]|uniref:IclR family transcriptional regulator C-terminal domain-containing protein n=1 Tax=Actinocorallia longicatena TaxID=111803 RepID=A0ABP6QGS5_9ACTN
MGEGGEAGAAGPLERGLEVLGTISRARAPMRPADLARATGLARSTVDRIIATLAAAGHLRVRERDVVLAPQAMEPGNAYLAGTGLCEELAAQAVALADELDESVSLAVPDRDGVRFVAQSPRRRTMSVAFRVGDLLPAERCAPGPLFAADWDEETRRGRRDRPDPGRFSIPPLPSDSFDGRITAAVADGYSVDDQLIEPGLIAVAVPLRDTAGTAVCAVSVVSHTSRHTAASLLEHAGPVLARRAAGMETALAAPAEPGYVPAVPPELGPDLLSSLGRGLSVLTALGTPGGLTLSEVAGRTGLPRATARRALLGLAHLGHVRADGRRFVLLPSVLDLGYRSLTALSFGDLARPHLAALVARVDDSASLAVLDGAEARYVARAPAGRLMRATIEVGTRLPARVTALGRVLLADLDPADARAEPDAAPLAAVRRDGHSLVDHELEDGLRSLAVPVRDRSGRAVAALGVSCPTGRETPDQTLARLLGPLEETAAAVEADLSVVTAFHDLPIV